MLSFLALCHSGSNPLSLVSKKNSAPLRSVTAHIEEHKVKGTDVIAAFCYCHKTVWLNRPSTAKSPARVTGERENLISFSLSAAFSVIMPASVSALAATVNVCLPRKRAETFRLAPHSSSAGQLEGRRVCL